jgi:hypothetical protein
MAQRGPNKAEEQGVAARSLAMARAISHPTRVAILMEMNSPRRKLSPVVFARDRGLELNRVSYHFRELEKVGCIELVDRVPRRGATEHVYEPRTTALAWQAEWERLGPVVQQTLLATVAGAGVQMLGRAIDGGTFEAHPESHLSWHTMRMDLEAFTKAGAIMDRALSELMKLEAEAVERADGDDDELFLGSFWMQLFESPPKQE